MIPISASHLNTKQRPAAAALRLLLINSANTTMHNAKLTTVHHCTLNELCCKPKPQHISHQPRINNNLIIILDEWCPCPIVASSGHLTFEESNLLIKSDEPQIWEVDQSIMGCSC